MWHMRKFDVWRYFDIAVRCPNWEQYFEQFIERAVVDNHDVTRRGWISVTIKQLKPLKYTCNKLIRVIS
ncbi:hypothetical protein T4D_3577 [Trichinella pseudospiralis]|uniref:Uncharacterized protein n=1 Tax=Trichinella pseudospiralis TaxID=6337 RepID=A0A0V1FWR3_TRIPS|nr:hypothetical protein T4D_3577 [Trichinella pseudospiralis]